MSLWRQISRGVRALVSRHAADRDIDDEVRHYFEEAVADLAARGVPPGEARRQTRLEFGTMIGVSGQVRAYGWERSVGAALADLRYGARRLRAAPGFTAVVLLTLAIGVGGTTAIFSAINPILIRPLPYPHPERLATILENGAAGRATFGMFRELTSRSRSFESMAAFKPWQPTVTGPAEPERLEGQRVSADYFRVLGVSPLVGRDFQAVDDRVRGPDVVILGDALWRRRFNADPAIVGREIRLDDQLFTVIGVMPASFANLTAPTTALWAPLQYDPSLVPDSREWGHHLEVIARLRPDIPLAAASQETSAVARDVLAERRPRSYDPQTLVTAVSLQAHLTQSVRPALLVIFAATAMVLAIACVNVTNLLVARGVRRRGELVLRMALGAGRGRLVRQLLTESVLLSIVGGAAGLAAAAVGVRWLIALAPADLPRVRDISIDGPVLVFAIVLTTLIGLAFGLVPALQGSSGDMQQALQSGSPRTSGGDHRTRGALVVAEVALALMLLVSSGLLFRSIQRLFAQPAGFDPSHVLTMEVQESGQRYRRDEARLQFFASALDAVRRLPGVASTAYTSQLPLSGDRDEYGAEFQATPSIRAETSSVFRYAVSPGYLETMRIPLLRGRTLDQRDGAGRPLVAVISESIMNGHFRGTDPIGARLRIGGPETSPLYTIVGVVGNVRQMSLATPDSDAVYIIDTQWHWIDTSMSFVVRSNGDAAALGPAVRNAVWSIDRNQPVLRMATMEDIVSATAGERRFALILFEAFALAALVLAAAGIYGVLSGRVEERTREIGVRSALGASRGDIMGLVVREGMLLTAIGAAFGLAGALGATRALTGMLFGVSPLDPATYGTTLMLMTIVSAVACGVPAWRAARVDPAVTLRSE